MPDKFQLYDFVKESNRIEGIHVVRDHEIAAHKKLLSYEALTVNAIEEFVCSVASARLRCVAGMNVYVGNHIPPLGGPWIEKALDNLLISVSAKTINSYDAHIQYETLHPFMDGNGRSGRAIWLWMMGGSAPLGFLHEFYYQTLGASQ